MKTISHFKTYVIGILFISIFYTTIQAQVGIGTINPNNNSLLDINSTATDPGGLLFPRMDLTGTGNVAPLAAHVAGMVVYNTATAGDVTPGYYFNTGSAWARVTTGTTTSGWALTGNTGTTPGTGLGQNYIGTADARGLIFGTNSTERLRLLSNGQTSINNATPVAGDRFSVTGATTEWAINGYTDNSTGVYGENSAGAGNGVFGNSSNVGIRGFGAHGSIMESGLNTGYGAIAWNTTASGANRTGLLALGQFLFPLSFANTGAILYGVGSGGASFSSSATGTGLYGIGNGGLTVFGLTGGSGLSGTGALTGVYGIATSTTGTRQGAYFTMLTTTPATTDDPVAILAGYNGTDYFGGYFDGNQDNTNNGGGNNVGEDYAYVGITVGNTTYKILGTGSNSTMVNDANGNKRVLFSPEAPEILFEDYGTGQLSNGQSTIQIDPLFSSIIHVSNEHPLKVFIQLEGDCNGVYVTNKSADGFTVKELNSGRSNVPFSWHIVANRADTKGNSGQLISKHVDVRFPIGPNKISPLDLEEKEAKPVTGINKASDVTQKAIIELQGN